jgi:uncharacterized linocin/CFP29 family protein
MTDHLLRHLAPISDASWDAIEQDVKPRLEAQLAARKLVDFDGPMGWQHAATSLGRARPIAGLSSELTASQRTVLPLVEVRADFSLSRAELADAERGAQDIELVPLEHAARHLAIAENQTVFHGYVAAGIVGITEAASHDPIVLGADVNSYPAAVARAVNSLRQAGIGGPYGLAIAPDHYTEIIETTEHGGYPLFDHLREILEGDVVWAPGVHGGVVLSQRGGDFVFDCGEDISIGYAAHDADTVDLYLVESYTFRVVEPDAAVVLQAANHT